MKKILTVLLSLSILIAMPAQIFAEENPIETVETLANATEGEIILTASKASEYFIKLPKTLDISNNSTTFNIYARGDIDGSMEIVFEEKKNNGNDNKLVDDAGLKDDKVLTVTCSGAISADDLNPNNYEGAEGTTMTVSHDAIEAGSWSGTLPISIRLSSVTKQ